MSTGVTKCILLCDHRERAVTIHHTEWASIRHKIAEYNIGDYAIVDPTGRLLVIFERKTLEDFAASFKDGRHENRQKLAAVSAKTGCRVVYIIEHANWPRQSDTYGHIPYRAIESAIFHLVVRDGVCVLRTRDTLDTAQTLARFVHSCDTVYQSLPDALAPAVLPAPSGLGGNPDGAAAEPPADAQSAARSLADAQPAAVAGTLDDTIRMLTARHTRPDADVVRTMWAQFRGITCATADEYIEKMSLRELFTRTGAAAELWNLRLSSGKPPPARAARSLAEADPAVEARVLAAIPGISAATARAVVRAHRLRALLTYDAGAISIVKVPGRSGERNLGMHNAERILHYFSYRHPVAAPK